MIQTNFLGNRFADRCILQLKSSSKINYFHKIGQNFWNLGTYLMKVVWSFQNWQIQYSWKNLVSAVGSNHASGPNLSFIIKYLISSAVCEKFQMISMRYDDFLNEGSVETFHRRPNDSYNDETKFGATAGECF